MSNKIVIIGAGFVGSTIGYAIMNWGLASEIVLVDIDEAKAEGEAMDLSHGAAFVKPVEVKSGGYEECEDADIVIITAGANQKPGETRLDLVQKNTEVFKNIVPDITKYTRDAILLVVSNPVDILTYVTYKLSGLPRHQVIGSGTVLDTSRFRHLLSKHCHLDPRNVHAYIIGEHGDHEVAAWSLTNVAGIPFEKYCHQCNEDCEYHCDGSCSEAFKKDVAEDVKESAYEIIEKKDATYYAIGLAVSRIIESIMRDENTILTISSVLKGHYGISDIALSLPSIVDKNGVKKVLDLDISDSEKQKFVKSSEMMQELIGNLSDI